MTATSPVSGPANGPGIRRWLGGVFTRRAWAQFCYLCLVLVLTPCGLAYAAVTLGLGLGLAITIFGLAVLAALVLGARGWAGCTAAWPAPCSTNTSRTPHRDDGDRARSASSAAG
jgi:hypothetical protein